MSNWNKVFKPIVVLCAICIVVTGALAATNNVTAPIIEAATQAAEEAARTELLPDAQGFEAVDLTAENVSAIYKTTNDVGVVITSSAKGYGGDVVVMTAFNPDGTIKQIKVTQQEETQSIGTARVTGNADYWTRYEGLASDHELVLNQDVDAATGATISSRAVLSAVNSAIAAYNQIP